MLTFNKGVIMKLSKQIKDMLSEDCIEVLAYLETQNVSEKKEIFKLVENQNAINNLEVTILQLTRIFGAYAFSNTDNIDIFKNRLLVIYKDYPSFKIFNSIYLKEISLKDINPLMPEDSFVKNSKELKEYINSI